MEDKGIGGLRDMGVGGLGDLRIYNWGVSSFMSFMIEEFGEVEECWFWGFENFCVFFFKCVCIL